MFGCSALDGYVAVANSSQNNSVTIKKGDVEVFKSQEFFFKILKIQLYKIAARILLIVATDKIVIYELQE